MVHSGPLTSLQCQLVECCTVNKKTKQNKQANKHTHIIMCVCIHLDMIWSQNDPPTEAVAQIDDSHTAAEPDHIRESCSERHDQDLCETMRQTGCNIET